MKQNYSAKAKEPKQKTRSQYLVGCLRSPIYAAILEVLFEKESARPSKVFEVLEKTFKVSIEYVSVYLNRMVKYKVLSKRKPDAAKLAVYYQFESDTRKFLTAYYEYAA